MSARSGHLEDELRDAIVAALREAGAAFAFLHGSRARGDATDSSDVDIAAWWHHDPPMSFDVELPSGVDLIVLNTAPLEIAGRVAMHGLLLFDDDTLARINWLATTRKIYADELPRLAQAHKDFAEAVRGGR